MPVDPRLQRRIVRFQLAKPSNVGAIGRTDEVRKHMHLAECLANETVCRGGVRERGPISAGYLAASHRFAPLRPDSILAVRLGELVDRDTVAVVQRLVEQLGRLVVAAGETDGGAVQFVVGAAGRDKTQLSQNLPQLAR